jgi:hypothetical protein
VLSSVVLLFTRLAVEVVVVVLLVVVLVVHP